jgi:hypothetical protein
LLTTFKGSWVGVKESETVTDEEAWNFEQGDSLNGVWESSDGYTEYYWVDQGFFEGVYVKDDNTYVGRLYGHSFDGSNYVAWWEEYDLTNDTAFEWGNALGT